MPPMLSDPAAAAWIAAGKPSVDGPAPVDDRCGRCGQSGPTVPSSRIISERFTAFDTWPFGSRRLCVACAWAYSRQPTTQPALLITVDTVTEYPHEAALADILIRGPLPDTHSVVLPTARRRHILPTADWAHLATDGFVIRWTTVAAAKLAHVVWLRTTVGSTWPQLCNPAPPSRLVTRRPSDDWSLILTAWASLQPWRAIPALWACARVLSAPPKARADSAEPLLEAGAVR